MVWKAFEHYTNIIKRIPRRTFKSLFSGFLLQLLLKVMGFSVTGFSVMVKQATMVDIALLGVFEKFISNQLDLVNASVSEVKRIHSFRAEILKGAQTVIEGVTDVCHAFWDTCLANSASTADGDHAEHVNSTIGVVRCTVEKLCQLGVVAASNGGSLVTILNMSWKSVVSLLHLGKGALAIHLSVCRIILSLLSLAKNSFLSTIDTWLSPTTPKDSLSSEDARRSLLPAKFYLINAVRISVLHPLDLLPAHRDFTDCLLTTSASLIFISFDPLLHGPAEALAEFLLVSFSLLKSLLNSSKVEVPHKLQVIDRLFPEDGSLEPEDACQAVSLKFGISREETLLLGRVVLFVNLLEYCRELGEDSLLGVAEKLEWLLDTLVHPVVYSKVLAVTVPIVYGSGDSRNVERRPLFSWIMHSSKTFLLVVGASGSARDGILPLLLGNLLNPHFLCREMAVELISFVTRYMGPNTVDGIFEFLMSALMRFASCPAIFIVPGSPLRMLAGSVSLLMSHAPHTVIDRVCCRIFNLSESWAVFAALVAEGLPLDSLSDGVKVMLRDRISKEFALLVESSDMKVAGDGGRVLLFHAAVAASQYSKLGECGIGYEKLTQIIERCRDNGVTDFVLGKTLEVISKSSCMYRSVEFGRVVFALRDIFNRWGDSRLVHSKTGLCVFLSGLAGAELPETDTDPLMSALEELFYVMLRERHWAGVHLAVSSFGNFASQTTYGRLWRFVPKEATLSYDIETGERLQEDGFVLELKSFLEKGRKLVEADENGLLSNEASKLRGRESGGSDRAPGKKRKIPEGIIEGLELLRNEAEAVSTRIDQWRNIPLDDGYRVGLLERASRVRDVVDEFACFVKDKML